MLKNIETKYNLLEKNYKILLIIGVFLTIFVFWYMFFTDLLDNLEKNSKGIVSAQSEILTLKKQLSLLKSNKIENKNDQLLKEEKALKGELENSEKKIASFRYQLVSPKKIFSNLKSILSETQGIQLISMQYLPEELVKDTKEQPLYRFPIELTIRGTFFDIVTYLKKIEQLNSYIFWDEANYKVTKYPEAILKLKLHVVTSEAGKENAVNHP